MAQMPNTMQFGTREIQLSDFLRFTTIAQPVGEQEGDEDALYFKFEKPTYSREEVLALLQILSRWRPDECELSDGDLRIWWD